MSPQARSAVAPWWGRSLALSHVTLLQLWLLLLLLVSAEWVLKQLGAIGSPATVLGVGLLLLWPVASTSTPEAVEPAVPLRAALGLYAAWHALAFIVSLLGPTDQLAVNEGVRAAVLFAAAAGPALVAAELTTSQDQLRRIVQAVVVGGVVASLVGIVQFRFSQDLSTLLVPPGLVNDTSATLGERSIFVRPRATMVHPIEFGVVVGMIGPLGLHLARRPDFTRRQQLWWWAATGVIGFGALTSISRSAVLVLVGAGVILAIRATWRERRLGILLGLGFVVLTRAAADGLLGTLLSFFRAGEQDDSITGRTDDFGRVLDLVQDRPVFGVGWGRFNPDTYFILDNQVLDTLLEAGVVGLGLLVALPGVALLVLLGGIDEIDRRTHGLGTALGASIFGGSLSWVTFDAFSFRAFYGLYVLLIGLVFAAARLSRSPRHVPPLLGPLDAS